MASEPFTRSAVDDEYVVGATAPGYRWMRHVWRRRWAVLGMVAASLVVAGLYLLVATRIYHVSALLTVEGVPRQRATSGPATYKTTTDFLYEQIEAIKSSDMLKAALQTRDVKQMRTFNGAADPVAQLHHILNVDLMSDSDIVEISLDSPYPQEAAEIVNAVADAYMKRQAEQGSALTRGLSDLTTRRDQLEAERAAREKSLSAFTQANPTFAATDPNKGVAERITQLTQAMTSAQAETNNTKSAIDAAQAAKGDAARMQQLVDAARAKGVFTTLDQQKSQMQASLAQAEAQQAVQKKTLLPEHPTVIATQRKIEQLKTSLASFDSRYAEAYGGYLQQQSELAMKKQQELQSLLDEQNKLAQSSAAKSQDYAKLQAELTKATQAVGEIDARLRDPNVLSEAPSQSLKLVETARAPSVPVKPHKVQIVLTALVIGLMVGLGFASLRSR